jgi:quinol monooxygenase YgiN
MRRTIGVSAALVCLLFAVLSAQVPADATVYLVAYVDVMPSAKSSAVGAFRAYKAASSKEGGYLRLDVYEQTGRPGHFAVVEAWRDQATADAHAASAATTQFRQAIDKTRVSGYDQRPYKTLTTAAARTGSGSAVHVVSHVDFAGAGALAAAPGLLSQVADASRAEPGNLRFDVLQHAMRANHFTVVESWTTQAALDAHAAADHTRKYRDTLQPVTGSPLDERVYVAVE